MLRGRHRCGVALLVFLSLPALISAILGAAFAGDGVSSTLTRGPRSAAARAGHGELAESAALIVPVILPSVTTASQLSVIGIGMVISMVQVRRLPSTLPILDVQRAQGPRRWCR